MTAEFFEKKLAKVEFPNPLEVVLTQEFAAPIDLVFDVGTKAEHLRHTLAPFDEEVTVCDFDARVGGKYHYVFVPKDGSECSFRGEFLEVKAPFKTVCTWHFDGWPEVVALETVELSEVPGGTKLVHRLKFKNESDRAHFAQTDGLEANYVKVVDYLESLQSG